MITYRLTLAGFISVYCDGKYIGGMTGSEFWVRLKRGSVMAEIYTIGRHE